MNITDISGYTILNNNVEMPYLGLGVFLTRDGREVTNAISYALEVGYRHIDTASMYNNKKGVGSAIAQSHLKREDIFVTSKVWNSQQGYDTTLKAFDQSLQKLGFDYLDLYLVHWPVRSKFKETWRAMETLYKQRRVRAIGVSNFMKNHLEELLSTANIAPMVNQMEFHPYLVQQELIDFCNGHNIQFESWSPLMRGKIDEVEPINKLAKKYNKTSAQITIRWNLQKGIVTIPKSVRPERILSNSQIFDFKLSEEDMKLIDSLDRNERIGPDPNNIEF